MDLLKFGMEYEKSKSKLVRAAAKKALEIEIKRADRYEAYLRKKDLSFPDGPEQDAALFAKIQEELGRQERP
ncbi:MAG: hypothetical protein ACLVEV_02680 [Lachnospiraceae bacterium]|uniref:hypothetical protein n=1 Tax=Parablautia sp. Marseille-Q6255 TaxID=3039593 RepID=UPI0024BCA5AD|nr:hypothetical protein [Parablautia sp. Marseille-Q6255]